MALSVSLPGRPGCEALQTPGPNSSVSNISADEPNRKSPQLLSIE
jgi:hypothetical protein